MKVRVCRKGWGSNANVSPNRKMPTWKNTQRNRDASDGISNQRTFIYFFDLHFWGMNKELINIFLIIETIKLLKILIIMTQPLLINVRSVVATLCKVLVKLRKLKAEMEKKTVKASCKK